MRFEDERYVRVYTRDTVTWKMLGWEGQAVFILTLRKVDRAGILDLGRHGIQGLAAILGVPFDVVKRVMPVLLESGTMEIHGSTLVIPRFIEAQEAIRSDSARKQESRLRQRDMIRAGLNPDQRETVIYFVQSEHGGPIKIGRAEDMAKRLVQLQTSRPDKLCVLATYRGTLEDERKEHSTFAHLREKGEWFTPAPELMARIKGLVTIRDQSDDVSQSRFVTSHSDLCCADIDRGRDQDLDLSSSTDLLASSSVSVSVSVSDARNKGCTPAQLMTQWNATKGLPIWGNATSMQPLTDALSELAGAHMSADRPFPGVDVLLVSFARLIRAWKARGVVCSPKPIKMAEHLGLVLQLATGEVQESDLAGPADRRGRGSGCQGVSEPARPQPPPLAEVLKKRELL